MNLEVVDLSMGSVVREQIQAGHYRVISSHNSNSEDGYECLICQTLFIGFATALAHAVGKKHRKKVKESCNRSNDIVSSDQSVQGFIKDINQALTISDRSLSTSSSSSREGSLERSVNSPVTTMDSNIEDAVKANTLTPDINSCYLCNICNLSLTSIVMAKQHIVGSKHSKKLKSSYGLGATDRCSQISPHIQLTDVINHKGDDDQPYYCVDCLKQLNSKQQYDQHIVGVSHLKKILRLRNQVDIGTEKAANLSAVSTPKPAPRISVNQALENESEEDIIIIKANKILMNHPCFFENQDDIGTDCKVESLSKLAEHPPKPAPRISLNRLSNSEFEDKDIIMKAHEILCINPNFFD